MASTAAVSYLAIFLFLLMTCKAFSTCPSCKICDPMASVVKLKACGLKTIPENIPINVTTIDLSENPSLVIRKDSFLKFKLLQSLVLSNCAIRGPIYLPPKLMNVLLARNRLSTNDIRKMFQKTHRYLTTIDVSYNKLKLNEIFPFLPSFIKILYVNGNVMEKIGKTELIKFGNLTQLHMEGCGIKIIEAGAFSSLKHLSELRLSNNSLESLPPGVFNENTIRYLRLSQNRLKSVLNLKGLGKMIQLLLAGNELTRFNATELDIKNLRELQLQNNQITSFDMKSLPRIKNADFSNNSIERIDDFSFADKSKIMSLLLNDNRIRNVSTYAFRNITWIINLHLHNNNITYLPASVFKGISIENLYLFNNRISNMTGVFNGMIKTPITILLFSNKEMKELRQVDYENMTSKSNIYLNCKILTKVHGCDKFEATIICYPSAEIKLEFPRRLTDDVKGFGCVRKRYRKMLCTPCLVGQYGFSKMECHNCPPGSFYQDEMASTDCKNCPIGNYVPPLQSPGTSALSCKKCPKGTKNDKQAGYRACRCLDGFARTDRFQGCRKCNEEMYECKNDYRKLKQGFWSTWNSTIEDAECKKSYKDFIINLATFNDSYSRQTTNFSCKLPLPHKCPIAEACPGGVDGECAKGYTGVLCAICQNGYSRQFNKCIKCPKPYIAVLQVLGYFVLFVILCLLISWTDKITVTRYGRNNQQNSERTFADVILSNMKILLGFYQVLTGIINALSSIHWPKNLEIAIGVFEYIQFEILQIPSLRCIKSDWTYFDAVGKFWFVLVATAAIPFAIFLVFIFKSAFLFCKYTRSQEIKEKKNSCARKCLRAVALFLFATYPITSRMIVQILPISCHTFCVSKPNQDCLHELSYLRADYSVKCLSLDGANGVSLTFAYIFLLIPLGFPVVLLILLWKFVANKKESNEGQESILWNINLQEEMDNIPENGDYLNATVFVRAPPKESLITGAIKFSYENYNDKCWYWEVIEMIRKLIMTVGIVVFLNKTKIGLGGIIVIAMFFTVLQAIKSPIKDKYENFLQLLSLSIIVINLAIGAVLQAREIEDLDIIDAREDLWALGVLLVILNSLLLILVIGRFMKIIGKKLCWKKNV